MYEFSKLMLDGLENVLRVVEHLQPEAELSELYVTLGQEFLVTVPDLVTVSGPPWCAHQQEGVTCASG